MEATFVGHQTWLIAHAGTAILVDPVLGATLGHASASSARVFPPRSVDVSTMPTVDAIVVSHEHCDHFTLDSFAALPRTAPVLVGPLMPSVVIEAIESAGFRVQRLVTPEWSRVGALELRLFAVLTAESFWEQRVTQVYVRPCGAAGQGVYIGVDAGLSPLLVDEVERGEVEPPRLVVVANNSQIVPAGGKSIYSNPLDTGGESPFVGLDLLDALTLSYVRDLPGYCDVAIAGNGFVHSRQPFGPYLLSDNRKLAQIANRLSMKPWVHGPRPGETLVVGRDAITTETAPWVIIDDTAEHRMLEQQKAFRAQPSDAPFQPVLPPGEDMEARRAEVERELRRLGDQFALSRLAALGHRLHSYLDGPLGPRRFVLRLVADEGRAIQVAYDHAEARFVPDETPIDQLVGTFPFGLEMFLSDFLGVLDGSIQIWDLDGNAVNAWCLGGELTDGPVAFLYTALGEQVRPDLAARTYVRALRRLDMEPKRELVERAAWS